MSITILSRAGLAAIFFLVAYSCHSNRSSALATSVRRICKVVCVPFYTALFGLSFGLSVANLFHSS